MEGVSHGADADRLEDIGNILTSLAQRVDSLGDEGSRLISTLVESWQGPDVQGFAVDWQAAHGHVRRVGSQLETFASDLRHQAEQQRGASTGTGLTGRGVGGGIDAGAGAATTAAGSHQATSGDQTARGEGAPRMAQAAPAGSAVPASHAIPDGGGTSKPEPGSGLPLTTDDMRHIRRDYQVPPDEMTTYRFGPVSRPATMAEAKILNRQNPWQMMKINAIREDSEVAANNEWPASRGNTANDGHNDAFRHAFGSARYTQEKGPDWSKSLTDAHERTPENQGNPNREAMDLYNNEVGRQIAMKNPDADHEELKGLINDAIRNGEMVVIDENGELAPSNAVPEGQTGDATGKGRNPVA